MQTQRTAIFKTRKGKVVKQVTEHYLRDDIYCGLSSCSSCNAPAELLQPLPCSLPTTSQDDNSPIALFKAHLQTKIDQSSMTDADVPVSLAKTWSLVKNLDRNTPLILLPDQTVFNSQMDLLETNTSPFANIIILQSILDDIARRHYKTFQRMRALTKVAQFKAATTLPTNFTSTAQSAALGDELPVLPHAYVFADIHHRTIYTQAATLSGIGDLPFKARYTSAIARAKEQAQLNNPSPSTSDDSDDDYALPAAMRALQPLSRVVEVGSAAEGYNRDAKAEGASDDEEKEDEDALMLTAARWLQRHVGASACVVLLTNSETTARRAGEVDVASVCADLYVEAFLGKYPNLARVLAKTVKDKEAHERAQWVYEPHVTQKEMKEGVARGDLLKGVFDVNRDYWTEATVMTSPHGRVLIPDMRSMNRAINGDTVVIKLLPKDQWRAPANGICPEGDEAVTLDGVVESKAEEVLEDNAAQAAEVDEDVLPEVQSAPSAPRSVMPTGVVVGVWARQHRSMCGALELTDKRDGHVLFLPVNRCFPKVRIESKQIADIVDQRVMVAIDDWPVWSKHPHGHLVRTLGAIGDRATETEVLLLEHEVRHDRWSAAVEACLPPPEYEISDEERAGRVDLRDVCVCSIDPPGCVDIDDALHCIKLDDGTYEVGVHIADVTHYVKPGSALDLEAAARSTSVYLVDRRIDMIPARLSTNLCSLHAGVERLAFSTVWRLNEKAEIIETRFFKSVIKSKAALAYSEAQERIDLAEPGDDPITHACRNLMHLARLIKQRRIDNGALTLASSEVKFKLAGKQGDENREALEMGMYKTTEAHSLVEEFMLLANVSVAEHILRAYPTMALLRRHPTPAAEMLETLVRAGRAWGFDVDISSGKALSDSLDKMIDSDDKMFNKVVRMLTTRCMTQAKYMSSGEFAEKAFQHFGLACNTYTHFTSPIRRYADIIVHRLLATSLGIAPLPDMIRDKAHMRDVVENLNHRHRMAQLASRASTEVWTLAFFSGKDVVTSGRILNVRATGVRVLVPQFGIECALRLVPRDGAKDVFTVPDGDDAERYQHKRFIHDPNQVALVVGGMKFKVWQDVPVRICVKENKMRRRWLHVELAGKMGEQLLEIVPELAKELSEGSMVTKTVDSTKTEIEVVKEEQPAPKQESKRRRVK